ncbi:MAG: hypothetical protein VW270_18095, partial [Candidatus Poseidoniales archaeon]
MSDQELEVLETEEQQDQEIEEAKASFGDPSEVPDPSTKEVEAPGGEAEQVDSKGAKATSPTSVPKTKVALMASIQQAIAGYDKKQLAAMYASVHGMGEEVE